MQNLTNIFSLNTRDFIKGLVLAVLVPALLAIQQALSTSGELNWKTLGATSLAAFIGYLIKNFLSNDVPAAKATIAEAERKAYSK